ncbi:MAG: TIGR01440 family protein [Clostridia bacterium]|nr:TIGR01440 family protein [Clostridia bacterium]
MLNKIKEQAAAAVEELLAVAGLQAGDLLVIGCSSSEILGEKIGTASSMDAAGAVLDGVLPLLKEKGVFLAAQCCEHLNRAIIVEREAARAYGLEEVNVLPQPKAGGSFATTAWQRMRNPVAVEAVRAQAGLDIGGTLIGMHLKAVAVPVRLSVKTIGQAPLMSARTRPKFIGGSRAQYDESKL